MCVAWSPANYFLVPAKAFAHGVMSLAQRCFWPCSTEEPGHILASASNGIIFVLSSILAWVLRDHGEFFDERHAYQACGSQNLSVQDDCFRKEVVLRIKSGSFVYFFLQLIAICGALALAGDREKEGALVKTHGGVHKALQFAKHVCTSKAAWIRKSALKAFKDEVIGIDRGCIQLYIRLACRASAQAICIADSMSSSDPASHHGHKHSQERLHSAAWHGRHVVTTLR